MASLIESLTQSLTPDLVGQIGKSGVWITISSAKAWASSDRS